MDKLNDTFRYSKSDQNLEVVADSQLGSELSELPNLEVQYLQ